MNAELKQQLSNLLDESPNDIDLDNLLQALYQEQDLRNLYSRYLLIGTAIRGEKIHLASLDIAERIRNHTFNTKPAKLPANFSLIRWFMYYPNTWTLAATIAIFIVIISIHSVFFYQKSAPSPTFLSYDRHFWPGTIMLNNHQSLSTQTMQNYRLNNNSTLPVKYNNFINFNQ